MRISYVPLVVALIALSAQLVGCSSGPAHPEEASGGQGGGTLASGGSGGSSGTGGNTAQGGRPAQGGGDGASSGGNVGTLGGNVGTMGGNVAIAGNGGTAAQGGASGSAGGTSGAVTRDPWLWPFAANSIWNQPIGSGAVFVAANLKPASNVGADIQILLKLKATDPLRSVLGSTSFGPGRCAGTEDTGIKLNVPDAWTVPDAGNSPYGATPNSNFAFLNPNGLTVFEGNVVARCVAGGPVYMPSWIKLPNNQSNQSITGNGTSGGGQGASHMSALGGTIRKGELTGTAPMRHAIKINPFGAKYMHYSQKVPGFRWPATAADSYANGTYGGTNPSLVMGSLLAIPKGVTAETIGVTSEPGKRLFFTLMYYGAYFTEDAAWDTWDIVVERDAELEFAKTWGFSMGSATWKAEVNRLMGAVSIVDNNSASTIGGGGTPLQPLAPPFK